jgi:hypothetical protein
LDESLGYKKESWKAATLESMMASSSAVLMAARMVDIMVYLRETYLVVLSVDMWAA